MEARCGRCPESQSHQQTFAGNLPRTHVYLGQCAHSCTGKGGRVQTWGLSREDALPPGPWIENLSWGGLRVSSSSQSKRTSLMEAGLTFDLWPLKSPSSCVLCLSLSVFLFKKRKQIFFFSHWAFKFVITNWEKILIFTSFLKWVKHWL